MEQINFTIFFDTETTAANPKEAKLVQLAAILDNPFGETLQTLNCIVSPYYQEDIPKGASDIHGILKPFAEEHGMPLAWVRGSLQEMMFIPSSITSDLVIVAHNLNYDKIVMNNLPPFKLTEASQSTKKFFGGAEANYNVQYYCTMRNSTQLCKILFPSGRGGYKWPTLQELHFFLFGKEFEGAHDAMADIMATRKCYYELRKRENEEPDIVTGQSVTGKF